MSSSTVYIKIVNFTIKGISKEEVIALARECNFCVRNHKNGRTVWDWLCLFLQSCPDAKTKTLNDMSQDLYVMTGCRLSKQAVDAHFNKNSVLFMQKILELLFSRDPSLSGRMGKYTAILVKDSTGFQVPKHFDGTFKGFRGSDTGKAVKIQYEIDLVSGKSKELKLTPGAESDNLHSKPEEVVKGALYLRDMGYSSLETFDKIHKEGGFFVSRVKCDSVLYKEANGSERFDFEEIINEIKKKNFLSSS